MTLCNSWNTGVRLSAKIDSASHLPKRIDTLIGAEMRIEGDIACAGVLRVQGEILGNVACYDDASGTLVVDASGSVTGTVHAAHVAVRGRIAGPVTSSQSVEIHQDATLVGDVVFKEMAIHAGGVVSGLLIPAGTAAEIPHTAEPRPQLSAEAAAHGDAISGADSGGFMARRPGARRIAAVLLLAVVAAAAWMNRHRLGAPRPADDATLRTEARLPEPAAPPAAPTAPAAPAAESAPRAAAPAAAGEAAPLMPSLSVGAPDAAAPAGSDRPPVSQEKLVTVRGANPSRPTGVFLLISNEPSLLYRKKRNDATEGTRITNAAGTKTSIAVAPDELVRVARGRDVVILFQGQKVSQSIIDSGAWISFEPR